jgi:hypothetical protein
VETPGVFMYHCSAGPATDLQIKRGIHGVMIVYPRDEPLRAAREIAVEDAVYGTRDANGYIPCTDPSKTLKNDQLFSMFNGRLDNETVRANSGDLAQMYFVNVARRVWQTPTGCSACRDVHVASRHAITEWQVNLEIYGKALLGVEPNITPLI